MAHVKKSILAALVLMAFSMSGCNSGPTSAAPSPATGAGSSGSTGDTNQPVTPTPTPIVNPIVTPSPTPTPLPSPFPIVTPVPTPSPTPTPVPTPRPTPQPTPGPTPIPTPNPTPIPTPVPTPSPAVGYQLKIIRGTGQVMGLNWPFGEPLEVALTDKNGAPVVGVPLEFVVTEGATYLGVMSRSETTDSTGHASWTVRAAWMNTSEPSSKSRVRVRAPSVDPNLSVEFVTQVLASNSAGTLYPGLSFIAPGPTSSRTIRVSKNTINVGAIQVAFAYSTGYALGQAMSEVGVQVFADESRLPQGHDTIPTFECNGGTALSVPKTGIASCDIKTGSMTGLIPIVIKSFGANENRNYFLNIQP